MNTLNLILYTIIALSALLNCQQNEQSTSCPEGYIWIENLPRNIKVTDGNQCFSELDLDTLFDLMKKNNYRSLGWYISLTKNVAKSDLKIIQSYPGLFIGQSQIWTNGRIDTLDCNFHALNFMPESIGNLTELSYLRLKHNQIKKIPNSIGNLTRLKVLNLQNNYITNIPGTFVNLQNLEELYLYSNRIGILPQNIGLLKNLKILYVGYNKLTEIPSSICELKNIEEIRFYRNPIRDKPYVYSDIKYCLNKDIDFEDRSFVNKVDYTNELIEKNFSNGKLNGKWIQYFVNGEIQLKGQYKNGMRHGHWEEFDRFGNISSGSYKLGNKSGIWSTYSKTGFLQRDEKFLGGYLDGFWISYYKNKQVKEKGYYKNRKKTGVWIFYDEDGKILNKIDFDKQS